MSSPRVNEMRKKRLSARFGTVFTPPIILAKINNLQLEIGYFTESVAQRLF